MTRYPVLTDEDIWPEFVEAVRSVGTSWRAPSGRVFDIDFDGKRLTVWYANGIDDVDGDLLELAAAIHEAAGGIWSGDAVRQTAAIWGWSSQA